MELHEFLQLHLSLGSPGTAVECEYQRRSRRQFFNGGFLPGVIRQAQGWKCISGLEAQGHENGSFGYKAAARLKSLWVETASWAARLVMAVSGIRSSGHISGYSL